MKKYITIIDAFGATLGYHGPDVAISHRVLIENQHFYGFESVQKLFSTHQAMVEFLETASKLQAGASGTLGNDRLTWHVD